MTYTVTVDVHDLEPTGPVPATAELRIARVYPDASGTQVVSTREHAVPVGAGPTTVVLTAGVVYRAHFTGLAGWATPFTFSATADCSFAELYRSHQVDPATLTPITESKVVDNGDGTATFSLVTDSGDGTALV